MLNVRVLRDGAWVISHAEVVENYKYDGDTTVENRNDWKTFNAAFLVACALGDGYVATDAGDWVSPRYDVVRRPHVGDEVSFEFNGDSYPCGKVVKVSPGPEFRRVETSDGKVFWRRRRTGAWVYDKTWSLTRGHTNRRNPEF